MKWYQVFVTIDGDDTFMDYIMANTPHQGIQKAAWNWQAASHIRLVEGDQELEFSR